jgi:hypothetical protein
MRLFRRSLLCLVVGVTAFGVTGWGFWPRATWTTVVGEKDQLLRFVEPIDRTRPSNLIWIQTRIQNELWSFDAKTGAPAAKLPLQEYFDEAYVLPDGRVLTERSTLDGDRIADTRYGLYSGADGKLIHHRTLRPARWMLVPDGLRAFTDADVNDKLTIEFRSLDSDRT